MTFILDMASGTEYQGDQLSCAPDRSTHSTGPSSTRDHHEVQLRLEISGADCSQHPAPSLAGLDIAAMIRAIED
jgi:hypothetical protein